MKPPISDLIPPIPDRIEYYWARLVRASATERLLISFAALLASLFVGVFVIVISGWVATCGNPFLTLPVVGTFCYDPIAVYVTLIQGAFGSSFNIALTLQATTILLFTGLSVAVAFRAGMFNIGTQGQFVLGALATGLVVVWAGSIVPNGILGTLILVPTGVLAGAAVGGIYGAIPGALKAYADANEVITTIMLNFIAADTAFVLVKRFFKDPATQTVRTRPVPDRALLEPLFFSPGAPVSTIAILGGLILIVVIYLVLNYTGFGYDLRTSGIQPKAAEYGGVKAKPTMVASMALSGGIGGIGGSIYVLMVQGYFQTGIPPVGFDGITVSILAGNHPLGVIPAALLFGILKSGSLTVDFTLGVPRELVGVLRGLIILFIAMPEFFRMLGSSLGIAPDGLEDDGGEDS
ncbi:MAG: ABC transporter permease [Halodesulfurarchaeum sp.]